MATNEMDFDPLNQPITLLAPDNTPFNITISDIDAYVHYGVRISINYASQIGACVVLLVVLLLLTRKEKRSSPIFVLNTLALASNAIKNLLQCIYFSGPFYEFYTYFLGDYSTIPRSQIGASIGGIVLGLIVVTCVEASLVLQVKAVCVTMRDMHKLILTVVSAILALAAIGFRFGLVVQNSKAVANLNDLVDYQWLAATNNYVTTGSICFFSFVFVAKLGVALNERRKLNLKQFGPMQIIFIMGCQTLIVPAIFSILQNFTSVPELGSQVLTLTSLFLPLSSIWAAASVDNKRPLPTSTAPSYVVNHNSSTGASDHKDKDHKFLLSRSSASSRKGVFKGLGLFTSSQASTENRRSPTDLEMGTTGGSTGMRSAVVNESIDHGRPFQGEGTSRVEIAGTPVERDSVLAKAAKNDDEDLEKDLKIHMGRSFGVEGERIK